MDYPETIDYLFTRLPMFQKMGGAALKFNLDNISKMMDHLGSPHTKIKTIHVAGTNGKGSSSHMLASVLQEAGYKTGLYTSPHLKSFTERIKVNGGEIAERAVVDFVEDIEGLIDELQPSFFEITFAMAMQYFYKQQVDIAIIEVGMGGRLDSTNIIDPEICLITNISLDHQQFLGATLIKIATEKAGIIKPGVPVIISEYQKEVAQVFIDRAAELNCDLIFADRNYHTEQVAIERINVYSGDKILLEGLNLDLKGVYQEINILGVIALLQLLNDDPDFNISEENLQLGLENVISNTGIKGRWQVLSHAPLIITDTGHNEAGVERIINELKQQLFDKLHIVWGMVNDKQVDKILCLLPKAATYYFVQAKLPRALAVEKLHDEARRFGLKGNTYDSVMQGYLAATSKASVDDLVFIGGSTFVVAELDGL